MIGLSRMWGAGVCKREEEEEGRELLCELSGYTLQASAQPLANVVTGTQTGISKGSFV